MKTLLTAVSIAVLLATPAMSATSKPIWNQTVAEQGAGWVSSSGDCLLDNSTAFACYNDHDRDEVEEEEDDEPNPVDNGNGYSH